MALQKGLDVTIDGDAAGEDWGYVPPISDGLEYQAFFGRGFPANRNIAPDKVNGTVVGAPIGHDYYHSFRQGVNYVRTGVAHSHEMTFIGVAKTRRTLASPSAGDEFIVSNYLSAGGPDPQNTGASLLFRNRGDGTSYSHGFLCTTNSGVQTRTVTAQIDGKPSVLVGAHSLANKLSKVKSNAGQFQFALADATIYRANTFNIGSIGAGVPVLAVDLDIYAVSIFSRFLSPEEVDKMIDYYQRYYARYNIDLSDLS